MTKTQLTDQSEAKILILGRYLDHFGGAHKYLLRLINRLIAAGAQVHLGVNFEDNNRLFREQVEVEGASLFEIPFDTGTARDCGQIIDLYVQDLMPDVIDCESAAKSVRAAVLQSKSFSENGVKKIFTMHLAIKSEKGPNSILDNCNPWSDWNRTKRGLRRFIRKFDEGISVSKLHIDRINTFLALDSGFFDYIPNGVNPDDYLPKSQYTFDKGFLIGGCGGLINQKRFDLLLSVVAALKSRGVRVRCEIAGEGERRQELENQITSHGLEEEVTLLGYCNDIPGFLNRLDLFMMPSDHEGFPYAQLEAMATGLPTIVTDTGDQRVLVSDGVDGIVVPVGDLGKMINAAVKFYESTELREKMGQSARNKILLDYNSESLESKTVSKFMDL